MRSETDNMLDLLYPEVAKREALLLQNMEKRGFKMRMLSGLRSFKSQEKLFAQGRTEPGPIVTKRKISSHNLGLAVDNCFQGKVPFPAPESECWLVYMEEAKKLGFECGGEWHDIKDYPHIQVLCGYSLDALCDALKLNGIEKVWTHLDTKLNKSPGVEWATRLQKVKDFLEG